MKILVCGGRNYKNEGRLGDTLEHYYQNVCGSDLIIIHGGANGADRLAGAWAMSHYGVHEARVNANWYLHSYSAGPQRNAAMLKLDPDLVIAFPGGRGTANMIKLAEEAGVEVIRVE